MIKFKNKSGERIIAVMDNTDEEPRFVENIVKEEQHEDKKEIEEDNAK